MNLVPHRRHKFQKPYSGGICQRATISSGMQKPLTPTRKGYPAMEKVQRFGSAMLAPVLLFAVAGLAVALAIIAQNEQIFGSLAADGTWWSTFWGIWEAGSWTVFNQMELLFVLGLPIALAKMANARAVLETAMIYLTFNYFVGAMLEAFGDTFGVDYSAEAGGESGLKMIAGIKTLDTGILGAIFIAAIAVWIHNRYFEKKLPEFSGHLPGQPIRLRRGHAADDPAGPARVPGLAAGATGHRLTARILGLLRGDRRRPVHVP